MADYESRLAFLEGEILRLTQEQEESGMLIAHGGRPEDVQWKLLSSTFVFLMQLGFAMIESGMCRQVNVISTYAKNILDFTFGSIAAMTFGYYIAYGVDVFNFAVDDPRQSAVFNYLVYQATAATILSGAIAERVSLYGYIVLSIFVSGFVFAVVVRMTWAGGFLSTLDPPFHDFAGSAVVHVCGGAAAFSGAFVVGPRNGRWDPHKHGDFMPHDVKSVLGGVLILWVAWYGFNPGSTVGMSSYVDAQQASHAALTTTMSAATSGVVALLLSRAHHWYVSYTTASEKSGMEIDVLSLANGILAGLVSITAGCDVVSIPTSCIIGAAGGVIYYATVLFVGPVLRIDDVVDAVPVHFSTGVWGVLAVGFFHPQQGYVYSGEWGLMWSQLLGAATITLVSGGSVFIVSITLHFFDLLRVDIETEAKGLDTKFGIAAYVHESGKMLQLKACRDILASYGLEVEDIIETLVHIKTQIIVPLSPQAGDNLIR